MTTDGPISDWWKWITRAPTEPEYKNPPSEVLRRIDLEVDELQESTQRLRDLMRDLRREEGDAASGE